MIDQESGKVLSKKAISIIVDDESFSKKTNSKDFFKVNSDYEYYMTWVLCGPIMLDKTFGDISLKTEGYEIFHKKLRSIHWSRDPVAKEYDLGNFSKNRFL